MKKILFTLMLSTFALASFQASHAGKEENDDPKGVLRPLSNPNTQGKWIPQAPISPQKYPGLHKKWRLKAENNPTKYRMSGNTPYIFQ